MGRGSSGGGRGGSSSGGGRGRSSSGWNTSFGGSSSSRKISGNVKVNHYTSLTGERSSNSSNKNKNKHTYFAVAICALFLGVFLIISGINNIIQRDMYSSVAAKCIKNDFIDGWYYTTYEYVVDEVEYKNISLVGWEYPETIGKVVGIYYLKEDPNQIKENVSNSGQVELWIGFVLTSFGVFVLIKYIKMTKEKDTKQNAKSVILIKKEKVYCEYCKSLINDGLNSCPNCGASIKEKTLKENSNEKNRDNSKKAR